MEALLRRRRRTARAADDRHRQAHLPLAGGSGRRRHVPTRLRPDQPVRSRPGPAARPAGRHRARSRRCSPRRWVSAPGSPSSPWCWPASEQRSAVVRRRSGAPSSAAYSDWSSVWSRRPWSCAAATEWTFARTRRRGSSALPIHRQKGASGGVRKTSTLSLRGRAEVSRLFRAQAGVISRAQLLAAGARDCDIERLVRRPIRSVRRRVLERARTARLERARLAPCCLAQRSLRSALSGPWVARPSRRQVEVAIAARRRVRVASEFAVVRLVTTTVWRCRISARPGCASRRRSCRSPVERDAKTTPSLSSRTPVRNNAPPSAAPVRVNERTGAHRRLLTDALAESSRSEVSLGGPVSPSRRAHPRLPSGRRQQACGQEAARSTETSSTSAFGLSSSSTDASATMGRRRVGRPRPRPRLGDDRPHHPARRLATGPAAMPAGWDRWSVSRLPWPGRSSTHARPTSSTTSSAVPQRQRHPRTPCP